MMIRTKHAVHLVFRDGFRDALPRERTVYPGLVDLDKLRALIRKASHVNGRPQPLRGSLGPIVRRRPRTLARAALTSGDA